MKTVSDFMMPYLDIRPITNLHFKLLPNSFIFISGGHFNQGKELFLDSTIAMLFAKFQTGTKKQYLTLWRLC